MRPEVAIECDSQATRLCRAALLLLPSLLWGEHDLDALVPGPDTRANHHAKNEESS